MTPSGFVPFPVPPAWVSDHLIALTDEESSVDGPPPWDLGALPEELSNPVLDWLDEVCRWLNTTYAWQPQHVIPPCWKDHQGLAYGVAAFAFARSDAYAEAGSTIVWHEQYDRFLTRMNASLGKAGAECRVGRHDARPARYQLAAWPTKR